MTACVIGVMVDGNVLCAVHDGRCSAMGDVQLK